MVTRQLLAADRSLNIMDSDDSRDGSSGGNESDTKRPTSPPSSRSVSRSPSPSGKPRSPPSRPHSPESGPLSPESESCSPLNRTHSPQSGPRSPDADSARSRSSSPENGPQSPPMPATIRTEKPGTPSYADSPNGRPKSPPSPVNNDNRNRSVSPQGSSSGSSSSDESEIRRPKSPPSPATTKRPRSPSNERQYRKSFSRSPSTERHRSQSGDRLSVKSAESRKSRQSLKSSASSSSKKSKSRSSSRSSSRRHNQEDDDGSSSDSSDSSIDSSSRRNKNVSKPLDVQAEEISDGDIESDNDKDSNKSEKVKEELRREINISHEDLSDVSDLEDSLGANSDEEKVEDNAQNGDINDESPPNKLKPEENFKKQVNDKSRHEDGEEQLDFEAEDGECAEIEPISKENDDKDKDTSTVNSAKEEMEEGEEDDSKEEKIKEELEEGEVTDEDDARPEETEPRPVCRFFSRGQCTWGSSCRFLHPGVTDKGNYTMFELIRPVVPGEFVRDERIYAGRPEPPAVESAWERGLRTAKEMLRKSIKRKEQDIDFEEKKMNLSLAQEEFDKENGYYGRVPSPEPRYVRHVPVEFPVARPPPEEYYNRRQVVYEPEFPAPARERVRTSYRELPPHRMPDYYNSKYEEEAGAPAAKPAVRPARPKREVIVQREREERPGRADEWSDPWMRSKSPAGRKGGGRKRSYSSGSSYSSSSSSRSTTESSRSSYRSRSRSTQRRRRSPTRRGRSRLSPSIIVSERKAANERAALMNPPAPRKRAPSPGMMRVTAANPPAPSKEDQFGRTRSKLAVAAALARVKNRRRSSKSSSGSSDSSSSDSDSSGSSSSTSRDGSSPPRRSAGLVEIAKAMDALKGSGEKRQIKLTLKNPLGVRKSDIAELSRKPELSQGKKRPAPSSPPGSDKSKKSTSRREELLKQLKAVEDAIAKKRSKVN